MSSAAGEDMEGAGACIDAGIARKGKSVVDDPPPSRNQGEMGGEDISATARLIQLAITPIFLLVGIGGLLNVMAGRLARVVDRVRALEDDVLTAGEERRRDEIGELAILARRLKICHWAIAMCTLSAILVCLMVVLIFLASFATMSYAAPVAILFIAVMTALTVGLSLFFVEISISTRVVRVREEYVRQARDAGDA
jgi:hypothetical protein